MPISDTKIAVIIPAHNEERAIAHVVGDIPKYVQNIIVVCNNCSDNTKEVAAQNGAITLDEEKPGYGYACLKGIEFVNEQLPDTEIIVFLDGDYGDYPEQLTELVQPIIEDNYDFVIGARVKKWREPGSMTPQQIFGNALATTLMRLLYKNSIFTDLGPFRAIKKEKLNALNMQDKTYGWTVEMQLKALRHKFKYCEVPLRYRKRIGVSKVSGTVKGSVMAGIKILTWVFKYRFSK